MRAWIVVIVAACVLAALFSWGGRLTHAHHRDCIAHGGTFIPGGRGGDLCVKSTYGDVHAYWLS